MFKVATCDDDSIYHRIIRRTIEEYNVYQEKILFYEYKSGEELLKSLEIRHNLIFLDIHMPGIDGNETAKRLRKENKKAVLIFCTNFQEPTTDAFKVQPYRYIMKDLNNKMLRDEMHDILQEVRRKTEIKYLSIVSDGSLIKVEIPTILYISLVKHGSIVHLYTKEEGEKDIKCKEHIKNLYEKIKGLGFEYAHNSYIVNMANIIQIKKSELVLKNHKELNISRSKKAQFDFSFSKYLQVRYKRA